MKKETPPTPPFRVYEISDAHGVKEVTRPELIKVLEKGNIFWAILKARNNKERSEIKNLHLFSKG